jgi:uncharacterized membrane protein AbrB (regulator of aidB expression)
MRQATPLDKAAQSRPGGTLPRRMATFGLAGLGVGLFLVLELPLPFLFGPMLACLVAALFGAQLLGACVVAVAARTILGVAIGATVTPELLHRLPPLLASVAFIPLYVAVIGLIGVPFFHRVCRFDQITAYYAAMPGACRTW